MVEIPEKVGGRCSRISERSRWSRRKREGWSVATHQQGPRGDQKMSSVSEVRFGGREREAPSNGAKVRKEGRKNCAMGGEGIWGLGVEIKHSITVHWGSFECQKRRHEDRSAQEEKSVPRIVYRERKDGNLTPKRGEIRG